MPSSNSKVLYAIYHRFRWGSSSVLVWTWNIEKGWWESSWTLNRYEVGPSPALIIDLRPWHCRIILGRCPNHGRSTNVNILNASGLGFFEKKKVPVFEPIPQSHTKSPPLATSFETPMAHLPSTIISDARLLAASWKGYKFTTSFTKSSPSSKRFFHKNHYAQVPKQQGQSCGCRVFPSLPPKQRNARFHPWKLQQKWTASWPALPRAASKPPWTCSGFASLRCSKVTKKISNPPTFGCKVFTRPSRISGDLKNSKEKHQRHGWVELGAARTQCSQQHLAPNHKSPRIYETHVPLKCVKHQDSALCNPNL